MAMQIRKADSKGRIVLGSHEAGEEFWVTQVGKHEYQVIRKTQQAFLQEPSQLYRNKDLYASAVFPTHRMT